MKKIFLFPVILALMAFTLADEGSNMCQGYMLMEKGVTLEFKDYNAKDKLQGSQLTTVTDYSENAGVLNVMMHSIMKDDKDKLVHETDFGFTCQNGEIKIDMQTMMDEKMMEGFKDMEMTIDQTDLVYPSNFTEGQTLPDGTMTIKISSGGMQIMTIMTTVVDRKVEKFETIETPAGSFPCVKLTQTTKMDMGMMKTEVKSTDWFSMGVGSVRNESYDKDGALQSYRILTQIIR